MALAGSKGDSGGAESKASLVPAGRGGSSCGKGEKVGTARERLAADGFAGRLGVVAMSLEPCQAAELAHWH